MVSSAADNVTTGTSDAGTATASSAIGSSPHITKENINSFNYFQLFDLTFPTADAAASDIDVASVRRVYRRLSLRFHPDKDDSEAARHAFEVVHTALETIIDPAKRAAYVQEEQTRLNGGKGGVAAAAGDEGESGSLARQRQAQEAADFAADALQQREQQRRAKEAAARQQAQEQAETAQRLLAELTSSLHTPFQQMEAELVRDWDVDEEMVAMKTAEVMKLLRQLAPADAKGFGEKDELSRKRDREQTEETA